MFLTNISLKRPVFAIVVIIAMLAVGVVSFMGLPINAYPNMDFPYVLVNIVQPGASPDSIETRVTKRVEDSVSQVPGVKHVTSIVSEGNSITAVEFLYGTSSSEAAQNVKDKLNSIRATLPDDILDPVVQKLDMNAQPIISFVVTGPYTNRELSDMVDNQIIKGLNTLNGIGSISTYGTQTREIQIKLDKEKLVSLGLTTTEVSSSLKSDNMDMVGGKVSNGDRQISLRTDSTIKNVQDFQNVLVARRNNKEIRLGEIAQVTDGIKERNSMSYYKGQETISVDIVKQPEANTTEVADEVKKEIARIQKVLPSGVNVDIVTDNSISIRDSVSEVEKTLIEGCLLAVLIVFLFLRNWGSTAISAVALPTSIVTTFAVMKIMGFSLNTMSLMGLSLSVGLLVDDAIVVIENVMRHLHMGKSPFQAAKEGTSEIGLAVMATTFTVAAVFLPVAMVNGMIGEFFKQFGITVAASVLVSLFVSFTLVPLMSARYMKAEEENKKVGPLGRFLLWFNHLFDKLARVYTRVLGLALSHRVITVIVAMAMFFGSLALIPKIGMSFFEASDDGKITVSAGLDGGTTLEGASKTAKTIEGILGKNPQVVYLYSTVTPSKVSTVVQLVDKKERKESVAEIGNKMRTDLAKLPGLELAVSAGAGFTRGKAVQVTITGNDFNALYKYAVEAEKILRKIPGAVDVGINYKAGTPEAKLEVDRERAADLGVSPMSVASTLSTLFNGSVVSHYEGENDRYDVRVLLKDDQRTDFDSLKGVYVPSTKGRMVPLDQVTKKVFSISSTSINRYDKARSIQISANVEGISADALTKEFNKKLEAEAKMPAGVKRSTGGQQEMMGESIKQLGIALLMGILFIFLILAAQFESFIDPLSILFSLPFAIIGALLALFLGHKNLSMMAFIGIIMLMGLVTKNAILLIDFAKQKRSEGMDRRNALLDAATVRLRPIIMTTLAMIFGMIPTAIATGTGAENRVPMAYTIIGGLITSTFLTLVVVPVVYTLLDDFKGLFHKKKTAAAEAETV